LPALPQAPPRRRSDVGQVRLQQRGLDGLLLIAEHYGAPSTASPLKQATIWAIITDITPGAVTALLDDPRTEHDTAVATSMARSCIG
jgi:hypothetical protein